ncbi:hypothetical protein FRZ00_06175 [Streptomyces mobaraensis]|uniref:Uncharacterized protein n=1 Tax=Streptomyces mobaraensis TaxID=35621 RepID=A0A5N5WD28_STRMB|nr:hypothetical protein FRZ00_06175 [Streptomyces mobaraensis]
MTGRWPPAELPGLHVAFGDRWTATADYRCGTCGWTDRATGPAAVAAFVATIHHVHRTICPQPKDTTDDPPDRHHRSSPAARRHADGLQRRP